MKRTGRRGRRKREFLDFFKAFFLIFTVPFIAFFLVVLSIFRPIFSRCPQAIFGDENTLGARIYLNGEFTGLMEMYKYRVGEDEYTDVRLCTRIKNGDLLRAEKEGYEIFTAILETSYDDSGDPYRWNRTNIELTALASEEKAKAQ